MSRAGRSGRVAAAVLALGLAGPWPTPVVAQAGTQPVPAGQIAGRITTDTGAPIRGMRVVANSSPWLPNRETKEARTDANGFYRVTGLEGTTFRLTFGDAQRATVSARIILTGGDGAEVNFVVDDRHGDLVWFGPPTTMGPLSVGPLLPPPRKIVNVPVVYPALARRSGVTGSVGIDVVISESGHVQQARIVKSIPLLDGAALDSMLETRFAPTVINGSAVPVRMMVNIVFR